MDKNIKKELKFQQLSENRKDKVVKNLMLLGNLSNRNNYQYNEDQVKEIFKNIDEAYELAKTRFDIEFKKRKFS